MDIYSIVTDHDCQLILGDYTTWKVWADGCHVLPFIFRAPSEAEMQKCLNALQDYLQFSNFQPADEEDFVGNPHLFVLSAGTTGFVEDIEEMGEHNARILAGKGENL